MKFYFPLHLNGDNRGCEAIAKGSAVILNEKKENVIGLCSDIDLDQKLGVGKYVSMVPSPSIGSFKKLQTIIYKLFHRKKWQRLSKNYQNEYDSFLDLITTDDVMVSTGGDMMCYGDNQAVYTIENVSQRNVKSILWGCSMGEKNLTPRKREALKKFSLVYARETLSEKFFKDLGLKNVICYPDPAFSLEPEEVSLPEFFAESGVIGINVSRLVIGGNSLDTPFGKEFCLLLDYIVKETDLSVMLLPHVLWQSQDDRILIDAIMQKYATFNRIFSVESEKFNYCQLRYLISKCRLFIGGRTHSVISAYSTCVPSLALGYSIKARGIAHDLELDERLVVNCVDYTSGDLLNSFKFLLENEISIATHMKSIIPSYKARLNNFKQDLMLHLL